MMNRAVTATAVVLALALSGCGGSDSDSHSAPRALDVNEATTLELTLVAVNEDASLVFALADGEGQAITGVQDYSVSYLGLPGEYDSAFSVPWHTADRYGCGQDVPECLGNLVETKAGEYRFSPDKAIDLGDYAATLKLDIRVHGALASTPFAVLEVPKG